MNEGLKHPDVTFVSNDQPAEITQPSDCAFNFPPSPEAMQFASILSAGLAAVAAVGADQLDLR